LKLETVKAVKDVGEFVKGADIELKSVQFSALWLIDEITKKETEGCMGNLLRDLVLWKHPLYKVDEKKTFNEDVLEKLEAAGFITKNERHPDNKTTNLVKLTDEGSKYLEKLKNVRRENIENLLKLLDLKSEAELRNFANRFEDVANKAWARIKQEAKKDIANLS
jgi:DNA-binding PadR family transcriptional regulator